MSELLPCPFCGNSNILNPINDNGWLCKVCGSEWYRNTRPIEDKLKAELASRDEIIARLKEDGERLAYHCVRRNHFEQYTCVLCDAYADTIDQIKHDPDCDVLKHRQLMKELEEK